MSRLPGAHTIGRVTNAQRSRSAYPHPPSRAALFDGSATRRTLGAIQVSARPAGRPEAGRNRRARLGGDDCIPERQNVTEQQSRISQAFLAFQREAPQHAQAWGTLVQGLASASALDVKTTALAYLAVLAALRLESGIPFHVAAAKQAGASREEMISAILVGLPAAGHGVTQVLPAAIAAYDAE